MVGDVPWLPGPRLTGPFWDREGPAYRQVTGWLTDGRLPAAVEAAFEAESREDVLRLLAEVHSVIDGGA